MTPEQALQALQAVVNAAQLAPLPLHQHEVWKSAAIALEKHLNPTENKDA